MSNLSSNPIDPNASTVSTVPQDTNGNTAVSINQSSRPPSPTSSGGGPIKTIFGERKVNDDSSAIPVMIQNLQNSLREEIKRGILESVSMILPSLTSLNSSNIINNPLDNKEEGKDDKSSSNSRVNNHGTFVEVKSANNVYTDGTGAFGINVMPSQDLRTPNLGNLNARRGQSPIQTGNSSLNDMKRKVPLEYSTNLPSPIPLEYGNISSEKYLQWKDQIITIVEGIPKFTGLLTHPPEESWEIFFNRNCSKYPTEDLECYYVECHQEIWAFIKSCLDPKVGIQLERKFQASETNLCDLLNFSSNHPGAYKNAYQLLGELSSRFVQRSFMRTAELFQRLCGMQYTGSEDPKIFLQNFHECFDLGNILGDGWPVFNDRSMAMLLMSKLIGPSLSHVRSSIQSLEKHRSITVKDIEDELVNWWITKDLYRSKGQGKQDNEKSAENRPRSQKRTQFRTKEGQPASHFNDTSDKQPQYANSANDGAHKRQSKGKGKQYPKEGHSNDDPSMYVGQTDQLTGLCAIVDDSVASEDENANATSEIQYPKNYTPQRHEMLWDTGATTSITPLEHLCMDVETTDPCKIHTMGGIINSKSIGTLKLSEKVSIRNVRVVPQAAYTLFSLSKATAKGYAAIFLNDRAFLTPVNKTFERMLDDMASKFVLRAERKGNVWVTPLYKPSAKDAEQFKVITKTKLTERKIPRKPDQGTGNSNSERSQSTSSSPERKESPQTPSRRPSPPSSSPLPHSNAANAAQEMIEGEDYSSEVDDEDRREC